MAAPTVAPSGVLRPHFEILPAPDQMVRARNRKLSKTVAYLHAQYLAAKQLGIPALADYYRPSYMLVMEHWGKVANDASTIMGCAMGLAEELSDGN